MKIGITCYPTYGGSGAVATELGLELGRRGHEVHVISYATPFRLRGYPENVYFHEVDLSGAYPLLEYFPYSLALAVKQEEVALQEGLDVLHVHYAVPHATAAFLAREMIREKRDLKVVTTLHGTDITLVGQERSFFTVTKFSIEQSDAVTAVSEFLKKETYEAFGCSTCAIDVIPNFVNMSEYHPGDGEEHRCSFGAADHKVLMHISNFRELKRVRDVVRTFAQVRQEIPACLVLVGDGPDRQKAEQEARDLGVAGDVHFLGKMDAVADLLRSADLFLLPSSSESFGLAALEAMACGVPVVASRTGGLPEVVVHGESGMLADVGDVEGFAAGALHFLSDEAKLQAGRKAAIEHSRRYSAERVVPMYEALYQRVIGS